MYKKIIHILLFILSFVFLTVDVNAVGFIDKLNQPHLDVVDYNEVLESIKNNTLESVSIFSDETLMKKWANIIVSL